MPDLSQIITLGSSGLRTHRMGIGADQGLEARAWEWAFERGINYFYWGTRRTEGMAKAVRNLAPKHRDKMIIALQSYDPTGLLMGVTFRRALSALRLDYADVFILGKRDARVASRIEDRALALRDAGLVKHLCISAHHRPAYQAHLQRGIYDLLMVRYNPAHPGAEREVFPLVQNQPKRPAVIVYNSTRWGHLFDPHWMPEGEATPAPTHLFRYALSHPAVDMVLTAPKNQTQLEANLKTLEQATLNDDEAAWLRRVGQHVHRLSPHANWDFLYRRKRRGGAED